MPSTAPSSLAQESRGTAANGWRALLRPGFLFSSWPWRALPYALSSVAIMAIVLPLVIVTVLIVPVWAVPFAALERRRARLVGQPRLPSGHVPIPREQWYRWLPIRYVEAATWRDTAYVMIAIVFGILHATVLGFNVVLVGTIAFIPSTLEHYYRQDSGYYTEHPPTLPLPGHTFNLTDPSTLVLALVVVVLIELVAVYLGTLLALGQGALVRVLLSARPEELEAQVRDLTSSRATLVTSFDAERHSIERNLHDGVQQRLVSAALLVGTAELDADDLTATGADTARLRATLAAAHDAVEGALVDLRNTVRGIHPAVLTDHGLSAAVRELATRLPIPVALRAGSTERLAPEVEACAYFVASEALTNVVRHSSATTVDIGIDVVDSRLTLTVEDNGTGGADASRGSGLAGLQERAATVGGTLDLSSPAGGPTRLVLSVPG